MEYLPQKIDILISIIKETSNLSPWGFMSIEKYGNLNLMKS